MAARNRHLETAGWGSKPQRLPLCDPSAVWVFASVTLSFAGVPDFLLAATFLNNGYRRSASGTGIITIQLWWAAHVFGLVNCLIYRGQ
ncbi:uncharacterized protein B0T15DRAFT_136860 [Chaetomium strumarium]|uniref:Uncharacterized protein n=1 Tax=Chaetomium strumarium TaxID=1170767 RepID=A0AAJ0GUA6_9PEZI|nr:hypothetical protein B0T15DRAFT_136860 [Chaetomium strumarium]